MAQRRIQERRAPLPLTLKKKEGNGEKGKRKERTLIFDNYIYDKIDGNCK